MVISNDLEFYNLIQKDNSLIQIEINISKALSDFLNCDLSDSGIDQLTERFGNPFQSFDALLPLLASRDKTISLSMFNHPQGVKFSIYRMQCYVELLNSFKNENYENILSNVLQLLLTTDLHYNEYPLDTYSSCLCFGNVFNNLSYGTHQEVILDGVTRDEYVNSPINTRIKLLLNEYYLVLTVYHHRYEGIFCNYIDLLTQVTQISNLIITDDNKITVEKPLSTIISTFSDMNIECLMRCAREVIESEMRLHVHDVSPSFIVTKRGYESGWRFTNLFAALYMKLQLIFSDSNVLKKCENPTCNEYFELPKNNTVKKYCSTRCAQLMAKRKQREREKII